VLTELRLNFVAEIDRDKAEPAKGGEGKDPPAKPPEGASAR